MVNRYLAFSNFCYIQTYIQYLNSKVKKISVTYLLRLLVTCTERQDRGDLEDIIRSSYDYSDREPLLKGKPQCG